MKKVPGIFEEYEFVSKSEVADATTFSSAQLVHLSNTKIYAIKQKMELSPEHLSNEAFLAGHEYYRGFIGAVDMLLETHYTVLDTQSEPTD